MKTPKKNSKILEVPKLYLVFYTTFSTFLEEVCRHFTSVVVCHSWVKCIRTSKKGSQWLITMAWLFSKETSFHHVKVTWSLQNFARFPQQNTIAEWIRISKSRRKWQTTSQKKLQDFLAAMLNKFQAKAILTKKEPQ